MEAVRRLPEDRQQLLILKFVERLSNAEIGMIMGRTEGAIKSLYHRTLNTLRDDLVGADGAGVPGAEALGSTGWAEPEESEQ
jgi:DNA-directed RNA polymerase specialized sigma24 family protein